MTQAMNPNQHARALKADSDRLLAWQEVEPEYTETNTLDGHICRARERMGEAKWAELNDEWNDPHLRTDKEN